ncbi:MAG: hypothetical protein ORO03_05390 [Alphaproteobacteria bacterium]|nr:hypothetical protein [Alphaproteobacteria bacterium]
MSLSTHSQTLQLFQADGFTVTARRLEISLGTGEFSSFRVGAGTGNLTLNALGSEVIFSGAVSGNDATIAVGSGSFAFVKTLRDDSRAVTIDNATSLAGLGLGGLVYGGKVGSRSLADLTITGSRDAALQGLGLVLGGALTIDGLSSSDARSLNHFEAAAITIANGASSFTAGLTLASAGKISQAAGASLTVTGGDLTVTRSRAIALTNGGNHISSLGSLTASGSIAVTNDSDMVLGGDISTSGTGSTIVIALNNAARLSLSRAIVSRGGAVTIDLGDRGGGTYDSLKGAAATTAGFSWTTSNQSVTITVGTVQAGTGTVFALGSGLFSSHFTFASDLGFASDPAIPLYFSNDAAVTRDRVKELTNDPNAELHRLSDLNGIKTGGFIVASGIVTFQEQTSYPAQTASLTFWNVRNGAVVSNSGFAAVGFAGTIRFAGQSNSFTQFALATSAAARMIVGEGSVLSGTITVGASGLRLQPRAVLAQGTIASAVGTDLRLFIDGDFEQLTRDASFDAGANSLVIQTSGGSIRLLNPLNRFGSLSVHTGGGNLRITNNQSLIFSELATSGGSVVLETRGNITASGLETGRVSFRAGGSVKLSGFFVGADGSGQSVELNNTAAATVLGSIRSDGSVTVNGAGTTILAGDIVGNSVVSIATPVTVANDSTVVTNGGRIEFARSVAALNRVVGLRLDSGYGGVIALGGSLGSPNLSLGWVELNGGLSNPSGYGVFYSGGTDILTTRQRNWRNGKEE